jgi:hypothetical protein
MPTLIKTIGQLAGTDGSSGLYKAGQVPGYTGGSAIASGYVGETYTINGTTNLAAPGTWNYTNIATLSNAIPSAGVWQVSFGLIVQGGSFAGGSPRVALSQNSGATTTDHVNGRNVVSVGHAAAVGSSYEVGVSSPSFIINTAAPSTLYLKSTNQGSTSQVIYSVTVTRIA